MLQRFYRWVFHAEHTRLEQKERVLELNIKRHEQERLAFDLEKRGKQPGLVALTRELLKGFDAKLLDNGWYGNFEQIPDVLDEAIADNEENSFLEQVKELKKNTALKRIMDYNVRNQLLIIAKWSKDLAEADFGRATINGIVLLREDIDRLSVIYDKKHEPKKPIDPQKHL